jgi:hypothetical protein
MERQVAAAMNDGDTQRADAECATRVMVGARGDVAFRSLYRERYVSMVRLAALLVDRLELAEEIVQDCFAAVYQRWDEIESPAAYLRTTGAAMTCVAGGSNAVRPGSQSPRWTRPMKWPTQLLLFLTASGWRWFCASTRT